jgi:hypothetical protein
MKTSKNDLFSLMPIMIGTFFGGPLAATYYLSHNFKVMDKSNESGKMTLWGLSLTVILFVGIFFIPDEIAYKLRHVIPVVSLLITKMIYSRYQKELIYRNLKENSDYKKAGAIKTILVSLISLIVSLAFFMIIGLISG